MQTNWATAKTHCLFGKRQWVLKKRQWVLDEKHRLLGMDIYSVLVFPVGYSATMP